MLDKPPLWTGSPLDRAQGGGWLLRMDQALVNNGQDLLAVIDAVRSYGTHVDVESRDC